MNPKIAGKWMFIPLKNGINRYWSIAILSIVNGFLMMVIMNCWWLLIIVDGYCWSLICNNRRLSLFWGKPPKGTRQGFFSIGLTLQADQRQLSFWYLAGQIRRGKDPPFHACNLCCLHSASVVTAEALAFEKPWPLKCHLFKKRVKWGILAYPQNIPKWQSSSTHRFSCNIL